MSSMMWLLSALFLPLFPLSMGFNALFARLWFPLLRTAMLLTWHQIGVVALSLVTSPIHEWVLAVTTSILYGVRALALRELGLWTSFLATSSWTLLWIPAYDGADAVTLHLYAAGFSVPLVLLALLTGGLERRFGAAYTGLYGGLAQVLPRVFRHAVDVRDRGAGRPRGRRRRRRELAGVELGRRAPAAGHDRRARA